MRYCDELEFSFGWIDDEERIRRAAHALVDDGGVWLIDPIDWPDALTRARDRGDVRGVVQLLDRHERDGPQIATHFGVPLHRVPRRRIAGAPFEFLHVRDGRFWREVALWWPERRTLVAADALGTVGYFRARAEPIGVHPLLRLRPPRALRRVFPEHILCGHGEGVHADAAAALHLALRAARRRLPAAVLNGLR